MQKSFKNRGKKKQRQNPSQLDIQSSGNTEREGGQSAEVTRDNAMHIKSASSCYQCDKKDIYALCLLLSKRWATYLASQADICVAKAQIDGTEQMENM